MHRDIVIIPTFNEKENILTLIPRIMSLLPHIFITVVDDNSPDGTALAVRELMNTYPQLRLITRPEKKGLGTAYIHAFREILKDESVRSVIMMDADHSHDPVHLPAMFEAAKTHSVVIGSRYSGVGRTEGWKLWRRILSRGGNMYCRAITGLSIHDCTSGFGIINAELLRKIDFDAMDSSGYAFQMELKFRLRQAGATFAEIPIVFRERVGGVSKISNHIIREGLLAPWKMIF